MFTENRFVKTTQAIHLGNQIFTIKQRELSLHNVGFSFSISLSRTKIFEF